VRRHRRPHAAEPADAEAVELRIDLEAVADHVVGVAAGQPGLRPPVEGGSRPCRGHGKDPEVREKTETIPGCGARLSFSLPPCGGGPGWGVRTAYDVASVRYPPP